MWEAGDQFAYWAAQNNISGNFGATYNGAGNLGVTGSLNGQPLDLNGEGASIDRGVANAGISLFNQFAQMSGGSTGYRPLDRGFIPFVNAGALQCNGIIGQQINKSEGFFSDGVWTFGVTGTAAATLIGGSFEAGMTLDFRKGFKIGGYFTLEHAVGVD